MRTFDDDADFARIAVQSILTYFPENMEIVIVVPESSTRFTGWKSKFGVKLILEPPIYSNGRLQQKYTKLNADRYCSGKYILHMDSSVIFYRKIRRRDLFWMGKPILEYEKYSALPRAANIWKNGTSFAIGKQVPFEFSRKNQHLYPIEIYPRLRRFIEQRFGVSIKAFLATRVPTKNDLVEDASTKLFSDFNMIGAYLWYYERDLIAWTSSDSLIVKKETFPSPIVPFFTCQSNARLAEQEGKKEQYLAQMVRAIKEQNCQVIAW
eukprot:jgi/Picre1/32227/NNA_007573.t1